MLEKIVVIGSSGAGKSTFARALGKTLDIEVLHLDRYFWKLGWKEHSREDRVGIQQKLIKGKKRWIMEGSYISSSDARLDAADTIIFLDMPRLLCLRQAIKRHMTAYRTYVRPDIPEVCTDRLSLLCMLKILLFPYQGRTLLLRKINQREKSQREPKEVYTLRSHREIEDFLIEQSNKRLREYGHAESACVQIHAPEIGQQCEASEQPNESLREHVYTEPVLAQADGTETQQQHTASIFASWVFSAASWTLHALERLPSVFSLWPASVH